MGFAKDTLILMHDGSSKKIQKIKIGDKIMGYAGKPITITNLTSKIGKMYDIVPVKGEKYSVSKNHTIVTKATNANCLLWSKKTNAYRTRWLENFVMKSKQFSVSNYGTKKEAHKKAEYHFKKVIPLVNGYTAYGSINTTTINKFINLLKGTSRLYKGFSKGLVLQNKDIDIDPYILGYWLGDGSSANTSITTAEPEIVEYFENFADENNLLFKKNGNSKYTYLLTSGTLTGKHGRNIFLNFLKTNNLINNKNIPLDYKINSRENRLKLLAGIIDSDGHYNCNGYDIVFKSEKLADDVIFIARSLGFKAHKTVCKKTCTNGSQGRVTGTYYRFLIYGDGLEKIPCLLERKQAHERQQKKDATMTGIKINYVGKADSYSLEFNGNKFLLADFTVVHK